jgi:hypothetical protein
VIKEKNAPTRLGLRGSAGCTDAGRTVGVTTEGVGALGPRGGCRVVIGRGAGAVPMGVGELGVRGGGAGIGRGAGAGLGVDGELVPGPSNTIRVIATS